MKNRNQQARAIRLSASLLACLASLAASAQQPGPAPEGAEKTSYSLPGAAAAGNPSPPAPSPRVVLKVGDTEITPSDIESMAPMRAVGGHGLSADARRRMAELFV